MITLSLVSHTNAGKTTLTRTLLRRDVGEVKDAPHVTLFNEEYTLVRLEDAELRLWDTPGFGDSARLLKRLKRERNALFWFVSQTWDRITDRPIWCSQQAVKNVRDSAEVVLYLVNASEPPGAAGYLAPEMEILSWLKKPVIVLLNQLGDPRPVEIEMKEIEAWRTELSQWQCVRQVISLDAFIQCWVQESRLLSAIADVLPLEKRSAFERLKEAWNAEHQAKFAASMQRLAEMLVASALDGMEVRSETVLEKIGLSRSGLKREFSDAREKMSARLATRMESATNDLIQIHGLAGNAERQMVHTQREHFKVPQRVHESIWTAIGGITTGAITGVIADVKTGGLSFGAGTLVGAIGGGLGAYAIASATNLVRGKDSSVHWSREHFMEQAKLALVCYLMVAHFGRGRGKWESDVVPVVWSDATEAVVQEQKARWAHVWSLAVEKGAAPEDILRELTPLCQEAGHRILRRLYPH
ncbi:MAG: DUF3482 domain-containing protein [Verrucomicrobiaceae bacterium]|nr:DUF3482 domain-containing protein [Verrucomicrobiaceae bacterium]